MSATAPEQKTLGDGHDIGSAFDDFMRAFESFKETNDDRLNQLERRTSADVVTDDKLKRIDKALDDHKRIVDDLVHKSTRPMVGGTRQRSGEELHHKAAFNAYVRKGDASSLLDLESKALSISVDADGGYLVPEETERVVNSSLREISPLRGICGVQQVSGSTYKKPYSTAAAGASWVGEAAERAETDPPTLSELIFPTMELYAMPAATQALLDDAVVDIDQWIADEVRIAFAEQEGTAFVTGNGATQPQGLLTYTTVTNSGRSSGEETIGYVSTGADGGFATDDPADILIDMVYALKSGYRSNAHFVMNRATQAVVRKMKDADGNYIWQPGFAPGQSPSLMGFPIAESEDMPDLGADSKSIAFGDFRRGYLIVDRVGIRVLRDPYSSKPYVLFYTTKRVGGGVQDFDAIKLLNFG
ncbi:MAG: phage major capsid protein [Pseudomonadota bacterium]